MEQSEKRLCVLAFELNNDLAIMAGECELLVDGTEPDSQLARELHRLLELTFSMADRINGHNCRMLSCAARNPNQYSADTETSESPLHMAVEKQ